MIECSESGLTKRKSKRSCLWMAGMKMWFFRKTWTKSRSQVKYSKRLSDLTKYYDIAMLLGEAVYVCLGRSFGKQDSEAG